MSSAIALLIKGLNSHSFHKMYQEKLKEENEKALHTIRNYPGTLSFDTYKRNWIRRISICHCTDMHMRSNLMLRVHFVAREYVIPFKNENKDGKTPNWVTCNKNDSMDGGVDSNNEIIKFQILSLCQEGEYFILHYKLRRCCDNSTNFNSRFTRSIRSTQLQTHEEKNKIIFTRPRYDCFHEDLKCWFPKADDDKTMQPEAVVAQTDHEYFIMACVRERPMEYKRSEHICKTMDEMKSSSCI